MLSLQTRDDIWHLLMAMSKSIGKIDFPQDAKIYNTNTSSIHRLNLLAKPLLELFLAYILSVIPVL